jgi:tRNA threonylcarbamoyladenosine biosynthesis protein TsaB
MMNLLVLDTSTERAALGLSTRAGGVYVAATEAGRRHGRDLIPRLAAILAEAGLTVGEVDVLGVGLGPGSYTGLRVGVMAAKTLAYVTGAALIGLDSLEAVGRNAPAEAMRISVIGDAQRGDLYVADFVRQAPGATPFPTQPTHIERLADWLARLEPDQFVLGPGLNSPQIRAAIPAELWPANSALNFPEGNALIELARETWMSGRRDNPWSLEPSYLRKSAAEEKWESRQNERMKDEG